MREPTLRSWLREAPFTLAMSSGFFGFYVHTGALEVLLDAGLVPSRGTGSSAGALVTGLWCSGTSFDRLRERLLTLRREDFWDPYPGLGLLRGGRFLAEVRSLLAVSSVEACATPYAASVYDLGARRAVPLREGDLGTAIQASCALPVLFHPVRREGRWLSDGGITDRAGLVAVAPGERVLHHHLASRSPWRRPDSPSIQMPRREGLVSVALENVGRVHPFALDRGRTVYDTARAKMRLALDQPVQEGAVRVA